MLCILLCHFAFFFFKQKTAYEMRISDWSSDVCSSDLARRKFLRSERAELGACVDVVRRLAMSRPDTGFTLVHEGRRQIAVQPGQERAVRVAALLGGELADNSIAIDFARGDLTLAGVAGLPPYHTGIADHPFLFVNGPPVED